MGGEEQARPWQGIIGARLWQAPHDGPKRSCPKRKKPRHPAGLSQIQSNLGLGRQRVLRLLDDRTEGFGLVHGQIGQNLAVHFDASQRQTVDEAAVCQRLVVAAHGGVDPLDPQGAEVALAILAVTRCILVGLVDRLRGDLEDILAPTIVALCGFDGGR